MADIKRLNYFNGQFLREKDFSDEQDYHLQHQRDHARLLHNPGIASGLEVPDPAAGSTGVTVQAGVAYDDEGRRIVLASNKPLDLSGFPAGQAVYITITYQEEASDPTSETGISGNTRMTEAPLVEPSATAPGNPNKTLVLARVNRTGTQVGTIDRSGRLQAGAKGGDLTANSLTLTSDTIAPAGWATIRLTATRQTVLDASLQVNGTISGSLAPDLVGTPELRNLNVTTAKLADGAVTTAKIANLAVGTAQLADGSVTATKIADLNVLTADLADLSVTTTKLANAAVTGAKLANLSVTGSHLAALSVSTGHLVDGSVTLAKQATNSVGSAQIVDASVVASKIADLNVTTAKLGNLSVTEAKHADLSVSTRTLQDAAVTAAKIAVNAVNNAHIADGSVTASKIAGLAVSTAQIADNAITLSKIADLNVGTTKLANVAVTNAKLADLSVTSNKLVDLSVTTGKLANDAVTNAKLSNGAVSIANLKLTMDFANTVTIAAGSQSSIGIDSTPDPDAFYLVTATPTSASGNVSWTEESILSSSGTISNRIIRFKNNSTSAAVTITYRIRRIPTT